jgi:hypothetical protein
VTRSNQLSNTLSSRAELFDFQMLAQPRYLSRKTACEQGSGVVLVLARRLQPTDNGYKEEGIMKITKYGHACLLVEEGGARFLLDPGSYSSGFEGLADLG